jgi:hypothetical protein
MPEVTIESMSDATSDVAARAGSRILFVMSYPAYLRHYGDAVRLLAERGHEVLLAYDKPHKARPEKHVPAGSSERVRSLGAVPAHDGRLRSVRIELGCAVDYIRYLSPQLAGVPYLRRRMEKYLPPRFAALARVRQWPDVAVRGAYRVSRWFEGATPAAPALLAYLRDINPAALVITPLVLRGPSGVQQTQLVKAAQQLGIPAGLAVGSWDHLTSKGLARVTPDRVFVWNEIQRREAESLHHIPRERIVVTGAQSFDSWFSARPSLSRAAFAARVGLPADRRMVLFVGSSRGIADPRLEVAFVRRWIAALRSSDDQQVRDLAVLVRPHPFNLDLWSEADLSDLGPAAVWPRVRPSFPMNELDEADYFHSLYYSSAVLGINTSAMIEASIVGRQVYTIRAGEFGQDTTVHFHYLLPEGGGCVVSAASIEEHVRQLGRGLADPDFGRAERARFISTFVRPHGLDRQAAPLLANAIEMLLTPQSVRA